MNSIPHLRLVLLLLATTAPLVLAQHKHVGPEWRIKEVGGELLWSKRFANCDYGFYVLLPDGFIGHSNVPPNPVHDFLVGLPDPAVTKTVSAKDERVVWVSASYDSSEYKSHQEAAKRRAEYNQEKSEFKLIASKSVKLNGVAATRTRLEYSGPNGRVIEEQVIAVRWGIIYEIGMRTIANSYLIDQPKFAKVIDGFRFWKIHYCGNS